MRFSPQNCSLPQATVGVRSADITSTPDAFIKYIYEKKRLEKSTESNQNSRRHFTRCNGTETISLFLFVFCCCFFSCAPSVRTCRITSFPLHPFFIFLTWCLSLIVTQAFPGKENKQETNTACTCNLFSVEQAICTVPVFHIHCTLWYKVQSRMCQET